MATYNKSTTVNVKLNKSALVLKFKRIINPNGKLIFQPVYELGTSITDKKLATFEAYINYKTNNDGITSSLLDTVDKIDENGQSLNTVVDVDSIESTDPLNVDLLDADALMKTTWWKEENNIILKEEQEIKDTNNVKLPNYDVQDKVKDPTNNYSMGYMLLPINGNGVTFADLIENSEWIPYNTNFSYNEPKITVAAMLSQCKGYKLLNPKDCKINEAPNIDWNTHMQLDYMEPITYNNIKRFLKNNSLLQLSIKTYNEIFGYTDKWVDNVLNEENHKDYNKYNIFLFLRFYTDSFYTNDLIIQKDQNNKNTWDIYLQAYVEFFIPKDIIDEYSKPDKQNTPIPFKHIIYKNKTYLNSNNNLIKYNNSLTYDDIKHINHMLNPITHVILRDIDTKDSEVYLEYNIVNLNILQGKYKYAEFTVGANIESIANKNNNSVYTPKYTFTNKSDNINRYLSITSFIESNFSNIELAYDYLLPPSAIKPANTFNYIGEIVGYVISIKNENGETISENLYYTDLDNDIIYKGIYYNNLVSHKILYESPYTDVYNYTYSKENILCNIDSSTNILYSYTTSYHSNDIVSNLANYDNNILCFYETKNNDNLIPPITRCYWVPTTPNNSRNDIIYQIQYNIQKKNDDEFNMQNTYYTYLVHRALLYQMIVTFSSNYTSNNLNIKNLNSFNLLKKEVNPATYIVTTPYNNDNSNYAFVPSAVTKKSLGLSNYDILYDFWTSNPNYNLEFRILMENSIYDVETTLANSNWVLIVKMQYAKDYNGYYNESIFKLPLNSLKKTSLDELEKEKINTNFFYNKVVEENSRTLCTNDDFINYQTKLEMGEEYTVGESDPKVISKKEEIKNNYSNYYNYLNNKYKNTNASIYTMTVTCSKLLYNIDGTNTPCNIKIHLDYIPKQETKSITSWSTNGRL